MPQQITTRPLRPEDYDQWRKLWAGYNAFYGRSGESALPELITTATWTRFHDQNDPVHASMAEMDGAIVGLVHYLFHRSTTRLNDLCYLQDLFTEPSVRGQGVGRRLIQSVYDNARSAGSSRVYWQTHTTNMAGRMLYDKVAKHMGFIVYSQDV